MSHHAHVEPDPQELERAQENWGSFTQVIKYSIIGIAVIVALLALAFTDIY